MKLGPLLACPILACAACNTGDRIREDHHGDIYPTLRVAFAVQAPEAEGQSPPAEAEIQVSRTEDSTELVDYELLHVAAAMRWNPVHDDKVTLGLFLGAAYERNSFDVGAPYNDQAKSEHLGTLLGLRFGYRVVPRVELYGRLQTVLYVFEEGKGDQFEAGVSVRLSNAVSAFVAWRRWDVKIEEVASLQVDEIDLDTDGIALGFEFWF